MRNCKRFETPIHSDVRSNDSPEVLSLSDAFSGDRARELAVAITDYIMRAFLSPAKRRFVGVQRQKQRGCLSSGRVELYTRRLPFPLGGRYVAVEGSSSAPPR